MAGGVKAAASKEDALNFKVKSSGGLHRRSSSCEGERHAAQMDGRISSTGAVVGGAGVVLSSRLSTLIALERDRALLQTVTSLSPDVFCTVLACALAEWRIVFYDADPARTSALCWALREAMAPLQWRGALMPLLSRQADAARLQDGQVDGDGSDDHGGIDDDRADDADHHHQDHDLLDSASGCDRHGLPRMQQHAEALLNGFAMPALAGCVASGLDRCSLKDHAIARSWRLIHVVPISASMHGSESESASQKGHCQSEGGGEGEGEGKFEGELRWELESESESEADRGRGGGRQRRKASPLPQLPCALKERVLAALRTCRSEEELRNGGAGTVGNAGGSGGGGGSGVGGGGGGDGGGGGVGGASNGDGVHSPSSSTPIGTAVGSGGSVHPPSEPSSTSLRIVVDGEDCVTHAWRREADHLRRELHECVLSLCEGVYQSMRGSRSGGGSERERRADARARHSSSSDTDSP
eukprot:3339568-Pleurochrysis_carterae.AAC.1